MARLEKWEGEKRSESRNESRRLTEVSVKQEGNSKCGRESSSVRGSKGCTEARAEAWVVARLGSGKGRCRSCGKVVQRGSRVRGRDSACGRAGEGSACSREPSSTEEGLAGAGLPRLAWRGGRVRRDERAGKRADV